MKTQELKQAIAANKAAKKDAFTYRQGQRHLAERILTSHPHFNVRVVVQ